MILPKVNENVTFLYYVMMHFFHSPHENPTRNIEQMLFPFVTKIASRTSDLYPGHYSVVASGLNSSPTAHRCPLGYQSW